MDMKRLTETKIFIDSGDPKETVASVSLLRDHGFAPPDGQTTNPSLVAKNPDIAHRISVGEKLTKLELLAAYRRIVEDLSQLVPGDISVEVYVDGKTQCNEIVEQARSFAGWSEKVVIKIPITPVGLEAAEILKEDTRLNMTLCFSQQQAAAVYSATKDSMYPVYVSPFVGRLDDRGEDGMSLIANILQMYGKGDGHVEVLVASVRTIDHLWQSLRLNAPAVTVPFGSVFKPWAESWFALPPESYVYKAAGKKIGYEDLSLDKSWQSFNAQHPLTDAGLGKFASDWNSLLVNNAA